MIEVELIRSRPLSKQQKADKLIWTGTTNGIFIDSSQQAARATWKIKEEWRIRLIRELKVQSSCGKQFGSSGPKNIFT